MVAYFLDSSAVSKRYHVEPGSPVVDRLFAEPGARHCVSRLTIVEIHSVFARRVRMREIDELQLVRLLRRLRGDISGGLLAVVRVTGRHYDEADRLLRSHAHRRSLRTLDAIQLAVALALHRRGRIDHFVCADVRLCDVARTEGLSVVNPEQP